MLLWNSPEQWREEISFPGYSQVKIGRKGVISLKRPTEFIPLRIAQLDRALSYGRLSLAFKPEETVKQVHDRNINGIKVACVEIADLRIVSGLSPNLNKVSLDAVKQWRYEPAICNGVDVQNTSVFWAFLIRLAMLGKLMRGGRKRQRAKTIMGKCLASS